MSILRSVNGSVWGWGNNALTLQVGDNTGLDRSSPVSVVGAHSFVAVSGGSFSEPATTALKSNGSAWSWGTGTSGQLGDNTTNNRQSPVSVVGGHSFTFVSQAGSRAHALKSDGSAWGWGSAAVFGSAGDDNAINRSSPVSVVGGHSFDQIADSRGGHVLALKTLGDQSAWAWGFNNLGQVGDNSVNSRSSPVSVVGGHSFNFVGVGGSHSAAVKSADGSAWAWGLGNSGQLGQNAAAPRSSPVSVVGGHSFNKIYGGTSHTVALKSADGSVWAWGLNTSGQLGDTTGTNRSSPVSVVGGHSFVQIMVHVTAEYAFALKSDGSVWAWGDRTYGQLANNTDFFVNSPVQAVGNFSFAAVGGGTNPVALNSGDGSVWSWGANTGTSSVVGDNTLVNRSSPVSVVGGHSFNAVTGGVGMSLALKSSDGSVWAWGVNAGFLGDNAATTRISPVSVVGGHSFTAIKTSAAGSHTLALKGGDGSLWAWGLNASGQLGDNASVASRSSPTSVVGAHSFNLIATGGSWSVAVKAVDGSAWAWGLASAGQAGDNQIAANRSSPVSVVGGHSFTAITSNIASNYGLKANNGSVWAWGDGASGTTIGDNAAQNRSSPVSVVGGHSFTAIAAGRLHILALKGSDGSIWSWGSTGNGSVAPFLGDGTNTAGRSSPVSVVGGISFTAIGAINSMSYALKADGSLWSWGNRSLLGNNTDSFIRSPIQIVATTAIKKILSVPYANFVFDDLGSGSANIPVIGKTKKIGGVTNSGTKKVGKVGP